MGRGVVTSEAVWLALGVSKDAAVRVHVQMQEMEAMSSLASSWLVAAFDVVVTVSDKNIRSNALNHMHSMPPRAPDGCLPQHQAPLPPRCRAVPVTCVEAAPRFAASLKVATGIRNS